jgi:hypothetical protein
VPPSASRRAGIDRDGPDDAIHDVRPKSSGRTAPAGPASSASRFSPSAIARRRSKSWRTTPNAKSASSSDPRAFRISGSSSSACRHAASTSDVLPIPARRWVLRVPPDPYLRFDTNDYSLNPELVGRRVEVRVDQREVLAMALDSGELACRHRRSFARHRTISDLEHARTIKAQRHERRGDQVEVEVRSLDRYDALIA